MPRVEPRLAAARRGLRRRVAARAGRPACRRAATGGSAWRGSASNSRSSSPASRRPSELNSTSGSAGAALADLPREREPVHLRHVHVEDREVERLAVRRASAAPRAGDPGVRGDCMPHLAACSVEHAAVGRVVVDDQQPLAGELGLHADEIAAARRRQLGGRRLDREQERRALARRPRSPPTCVRPSARPGAC